MAQQRCINAEAGDSGLAVPAAAFTAFKGSPMGFSSNLRDAREAAVKLGADLKALHPGHAKQEYENVLERSRSLLTQIEQVRFPLY